MNKFLCIVLFCLLASCGQNYTIPQGNYELQNCIMKNGQIDRCYTNLVKIYYENEKYYLSQFGLFYDIEGEDEETNVHFFQTYDLSPHCLTDFPEYFDCKGIRKMTVNVNLQSIGYDRIVGKARIEYLVKYFNNNFYYPVQNDYKLDGVMKDEDNQIDRGGIK